MKRYSSVVSRRSFLKAFGSAAACLPVYNLLRPSIAEASNGVAPLRLICFRSSFHAVEDLWMPTQLGSGGALTSTSLTYANSSLAPLQPYSNNLMLFRGLDYAYPQDNNFPGHTSEGTVLTGAAAQPAPSTPNQMPTGPSIDQYLWGRMKGTTNLQPLVLGLGTDGEAASPINYGPGQVAFPQNDNPRDLYNLLFSNFTPPMMMGGTTPPVNVAVQQALTRRMTVLNLVQNHLGSLMPRLAGSEQQRLEQHVQAVTDLQNRLSGTSGTTMGGTTAMPAVMSCNPPSSPSTSSGGQDWSNMTNDMQTFATLISQAFACDLTRFASMTFMGQNADGSVAMPGCVTIGSGQQANGPGTQAGGPSASVGQSVASFQGGFHGYTHYAFSGVAGDSGAGSTNVTDNDVKMSSWWQFWANQIVTVLQALQAIPDPYNTAQTLFDNTVVLWFPEHGMTGVNDGNDPHSYTDVPTVVTGGCGGLWTMGRLMDLRGSTSSQGSTGQPHNQLLTAVVNAFETNQAQFNPSYSPNILTQFGDYAGVLNLT